MSGWAEAPEVARVVGTVATCRASTPEGGMRGSNPIRTPSRRCSNDARRLHGGAATTSTDSMGWPWL